MRLFPLYGMEDPSGFQLSLYDHPYLCLSVSLSLCLYVAISGHMHYSLEIICADHNYTQCMWPQAIGSNPLSGSIICLSVFPYICLVVRGPSEIFVFILISSLGFQCHNAFIPTAGSIVTQCVPAKLVCMCLFLYISLSLFLSV